MLMTESLLTSAVDIAPFIYAILLALVFFAPRAWRIGGGPARGLAGLLRRIYDALTLNVRA